MKTQINRFKIKNFDLKVGDSVIVKNVRSSKIDIQNGIGWYAQNVIVMVTEVHDITFCFDFNGEKHYALKDDVVITKQNTSNSLFGEESKIRYSKHSFEYRMKIEYGL